MLYITHDLATARHFSDEILVLYRGRVVERGPADEVILAPRHPYTKLLAAASPDPLARGRAEQIGPDDEIDAASAAATYDHYTGRWTRPQEGTSDARTLP
jgi:ABC-type oligopeptide transport system ATPase subunit